MNISRLTIFVFLISLLVCSSHAEAEEYSLEDLQRIALEQSETIRLSEEELLISEILKDKARAVLFPTLSAFAGYTKYIDEKRTPAGAVIQPDHPASWGVRFDQSMSLSGRELTAFRITKEKIEKSRYDLEAVKEALLFHVSNGYYNVLLAKSSVEIALANVDRLTKHRDAAQIRLRVGEVTKTDLLRAEAELSGARSDLTIAKNNLRLAESVLQRIVGIEGEFNIKETKQEKEVIADYNFHALKEKALTMRPEITSMKHQRKIAENQISYVRGAYWPTVSIEGVFMRRDESPPSAFTIKESIYGGIRLNFPFFDGGLRKANTKEAESIHRQANLIYEDLKKTVGIEVKDAYLDFQTQKGVLNALKDRLIFARDNFSSVSRQYEFGLASSIDVIDANTLLLTSERQLTNAIYGHQLSILKLKRATGTLLENFPNPAIREAGIASKPLSMR